MRALLRPRLLAALFAACLLPTVALGVLLVAEVEDRAGFFSEDAIHKANKLIKEIKDDFKEDLLIETFPAIPADRKEAYGLAKETEAGTAKFFNEWARSRAKEREVKGVYLLICKSPGRVEYEIGDKTQEKAFPPAAGRQLADIFLGKFKEAAKKDKDEAEQKKLHDQALIEGVQFVGRTMKENLKKGGVGTVPVHHEGGGLSGLGSNLPGLLCMILVVVLVVWVVVGLVRSLTGEGRGGYGPGPVGGGGYAPGYGGGGGGGFMTGLLGGMFGAAAGSFLYDRFLRGDGGGGWGGGSSAYGASPPAGSPGDTDYSGGGGDFDSGGDGGGGGGGGDFGGDAGGGGGDFGGDAGGGGGDFGGGGGDFGGGGGDFGGGGGDFGGGGGGGDF